MVVQDLRRVSSSSEIKSFLLSMCIDALESTTNSLTSGLFEDGAGNDQTSDGEKNVVLSVSLSLWTFFKKVPCLLCGRIFGCKVSSCVL